MGKVGTTAGVPVPAAIARDYEVMERLADERSASTLWRAVQRSSGQAVVLKQVKLSGLSRNLRDCLDCELRFLASVRHPNIIRLIDSIQVEGSIFLIMEFCPGGDLATFINHTGHLDEDTTIKFMKQLGAGLEVMHIHHIIHRDLKPENILLSAPSSDAVLKIADFDLARYNNKKLSVNTNYFCTKEECLSNIQDFWTELFIPVSMPTWSVEHLSTWLQKS